MKALAVVVLALAAILAPAAPAAAKAAPHPRAAHAAAFPAQIPNAITRHSVEAAGRRIDYTATAGTILLRNDKHQPIASMFYVAYTENGANRSTRPVTFLYNGGPGSSTIWLHMGSFAPVRVQVPKNAGQPAPK